MTVELLGKGLLFKRETNLSDSVDTIHSRPKKILDTIDKNTWLI